MASALILALAVVLAVYDPPFVVEMRERVFDTYQRMWPRRDLSAPVRVVDIDEDSLERHGQWPWPRTHIAAIVDHLQALGAAAVVFDIIFAEPDRTSPTAMVKLWHLQGDLADQVTALEDHDDRLASSVATAPVVTAFALTDTPTETAPELKSNIAYTGADPRPFLPAFRGAVDTLPRVEGEATGNGALNVDLSSGGIVRRLSLLLRLGERPYPSLVLEALRVAQGLGTINVTALNKHDTTWFGDRTGLERVRIGAFTVPTDANGRLRIYYSRISPDWFIPAWHVLDDLVPRDAIAGKIILLGSTAIGLQDIHTTPLTGATPGVSIHAQALQQILYGAYVQRPAWARHAEIVVLVGFSVLVIVLCPWIGAARTAIIGCLAITSAWAASSYAFASARLLFDPTIPSLSVLAVYLTASLLTHLRREKDVRWVRKAFASYVSPALVDILVADPSQLQLRGDRREISSLFTDLEGFTSLIERSEPEHVIPMLNAYLDGMIGIAFTHHGSIDKVIGDALHILFGAPVADPNHARNAVACAMALDQFAHNFAERQRAAGIAFGQTRIGLNSGIATVGNFGGRKRFDYTAHGDMINTAARLEGANKYLGTRMCVGEATVSLSLEFIGRPAGDVLVKGKTTPVRVFEPLTSSAAAKPAMTAYRQAFNALESNEPGRARDGFAQVLSLEPDDGLAAMHLSRLDQGVCSTVIVLSGK